MNKIVDILTKTGSILFIFPFASNPNVALLLGITVSTYKGICSGICVCRWGEAFYFSKQFHTSEGLAQDDYRRTTANNCVGGGITISCGRIFPSFRGAAPSMKLKIKIRAMISLTRIGQDHWLEAF